MKRDREEMSGFNLSALQKEHSLLYMLCDNDSTENLKNFLDTHEKKIDITFDDGGLFSFAMVWERMEVLRSLIDYYKQTQLNCLNQESLEYKYAKHKLEVIISDVLEAHTLPDKVLEVVRDYIPLEAVSDTEDDIEDLSLRHDELINAEQYYHADIIGTINK